MKLDFDDLLIVPKATSYIESRSHVNTNMYSGNLFPTLPIITAPMDTVIDSERSALKFSNLNLCITLPRGVKQSNILDYYFKDRIFYSYSLIEFETDILYKETNEIPKMILIDIANGHTAKLLRLVEEFKLRHPNNILMVGNVANPETYQLLSDAGADYVRVSIGSGNGCLTSQQTGVGYPMASLIKECYTISTKLRKPAFIVADGGMKKYSDIIKALALGADYVMIGSLLNKALESSGDTLLWKRIKLSPKLAKIAFKLKLPLYKKYRGMSTKEVQKKWGKNKLKTSEGIVTIRRVEYTLDQWIENFEDYLKSAMSYTGASCLTEFIGNVELVQISNNALKRFSK